MNRRPAQKVYDDGEVCPACEGTGQISEDSPGREARTCRACEGVGRIDPNEVADHAFLNPYKPGDKPRPEWAKAWNRANPNGLPVLMVPVSESELDEGVALGIEHARLQRENAALKASQARSVETLGLIRSWCKNTIHEDNNIHGLLERLARLVAGGE